MKKNESSKILMEIWKKYLSSEDSKLINEALKLKDFIARIKETWSDDDSLESSVQLIRQHQKDLANYQKVLLQPLVGSDQDLSLAERIAVCILHSKTRLKALDVKDKKDLIAGNYSIIDLDYDIQDAGEKSGVSKAVSTFISNNPSNAKIIYKDDNLIAVKPLTKVGSMAWGRGMYDGTREKDAPKGVRGRDVDWCTTVASSENMFDTYTDPEGMCINLYYIIKNYKQPSAIFNPNDEYRKICISFSAQKDIIDIKTDDYATVNAFNDDIAPGVGKSDNRYSLVLNKVKSENDPKLSQSYENAFLELKKDALSDPKLIEKAKDFTWDLKTLSEYSISIINDLHSGDDFGTYDEVIGEDKFYLDNLKIKTPQEYSSVLEEFDEFIENFNAKGKTSDSVSAITVLLKSISKITIEDNFTITSNEISDEVKKLYDEVNFKLDALENIISSHSFAKSVPYVKTLLQDIQEIIVENARSAMEYDFSDIAQTDEEKKICLDLCISTKEKIEKLTKTSYDFNKVIRDTKLLLTGELEDISGAFDEDSYYNNYSDDYDDYDDSYNDNDDDDFNW